MRPVRRADNLTTFMCRLSWNSGSLYLVEPLEPVQGELLVAKEETGVKSEDGMECKCAGGGRN